MTHPVPVSATQASNEDSAFWRFALALYEAPGVAPAMIELQDRHGADVNIVLFLLYLARAQRAIDAEEIGALDALVARWREDVVVPVRTLRRRLKAGVPGIDAARSESLRERLMRLELEAERIEELTLEEALPIGRAGQQAPSYAMAARANLAAYARLLGTGAESDIAALLEIVLARSNG